MKDGVTKLRGPWVHRIFLNISSKLPQEFSLKVSMVLLGIVVSVTSLTYSQYEDMGYFLSLAATVASGQSLYTGFFEIKDPLFMGSISIAYSVFGLQGPYLVDALAVLFAPLVAYSASRNFGLSKIQAFLAGAIFGGVLGGAYFQSLRTTAVALVLIVLAMSFAKSRKLILAGFILALALGFKFAYLPIVLAVILLVATEDFFSRRKFIGLLKVSISLLASLLIMLIILGFRGELAGYLEMMSMNFSYRSEGPGVMGQDGSLFGRALLVFQYGSNPVVLLAALLGSAFAPILLRGERGEGLTSSIQLFFFSASVLGVLALSLMWVHHLHVLSLLAWAIFVSFMVVVNSKPQINDFIKSVSVLLILATLSSSGFSMVLKSRTEFSQIFNPTWIEPAEARYINSLVWPRSEVKYSRVGPNDELGLAAFLPSNWVLSCPSYGQVGIEPVSLIQELSNCIEHDVDVVIVTPGFFALTRDIGTYEYLKGEVKNKLDSHFECEPTPEREGSLICRRK